MTEDEADAYFRVNQTYIEGAVAKTLQGMYTTLPADPPGGSRSMWPRCRRGGEA